MINIQEEQKGLFTFYKEQYQQEKQLNNKKCSKFQNKKQKGSLKNKKDLCFKNQDELSGWSQKPKNKKYYTQQVETTIQLIPQKGKNSRIINHKRQSFEKRYHDFKLQKLPTLELVLKKQKSTEQVNHIVAQSQFKIKKERTQEDNDVYKQKQQIKRSMRSEIKNKAKKQKRKQISSIASIEKTIRNILLNEQKQKQNYSQKIKNNSHKYLYPLDFNLNKNIRYQCWDRKQKYQAIESLGTYKNSERPLYKSNRRMQQKDWKVSDEKKRLIQIVKKLNNNKWNS